MDLQHINQASWHVGAVLPIVILMVENDNDRMFLSQLYINYRNLMYTVARQYFGVNKHDLDDAIGDTIERLCRYCSKIRNIPENKQEAYIVSVTGNACRDLLRKKKRKNMLIDFMYTKEKLEEIPEEENCYRSVFDQATAQELENAFELLSPREKALIYMCHVDNMEIKKIAEELNISYGAARAALSRARNHLVRIVQGRDI